jgi:gluconolactonase
VKNSRNATGNVTVTVVPSTPEVVNPNGMIPIPSCELKSNHNCLYNLAGGTNYKGQILYAAEGQGDDVPSSLVLMNPVEPYNTTSESQRNTFDYLYCLDYEIVSNTDPQSL